VRTLVLTLAVPVAAGIFGQVSLRRDVELKRFEQNLALVDRALDSSKGEAYRRSVLDYVAALNDEGAPIGVWAIAERDKLDTTIGVLEVQAEQQKQVVESKQVELSDARERIAELRDEVQVATTASVSDDPKTTEKTVVALDKKITEIGETVEKAKSAKADLDVQSIQANSLADRVGKGPIAPSLPSAVEIDPGLPGAFVTEPGFTIQVASTGQLAPAQDRVAQLRSKGIPSFVVHRRRYYVVMVGPYATESEAALALANGRNSFDPGARVRQFAEFCPRQLPVDDDLRMCVD